MENAENTARLPSSVKRILWILLAVLILALGAVIGWYVLHFRNYDAYKAIPLQPAAYTEGKVFEPLQDSLKAVPGFQLAAENENMALYLKEKTAEVAVYDKATGNTVYSNPPAADKDPVAKASNLENLKSQFILSYLDGNAKEGTPWSSYAKSVSSGQVSFESIENGVRVIYLMSNEKMMLVPDQLNQEWYDILSNTGKKQAKKSYVLNEESGLYEIKTQGVTARNRQQIDADAREAGFTMEDYEAMQALRQTEADDEEQAETLAFTVTLDWTLKPDGVQVTLPYGGISESGNGQIRTIQLLPFFGAAGSEEQGDLVIPEGSGALIHFNNGKNTAAQYNKNIYDLDLVDSDLTATQNLQTARLALFGICREDASILATCERGASLASISADVSGRNNSYNYAYFTFALRRTDTLVISGESVIVAEKDMYPVDCSVRYTLLPQEDKGYSGIAKAYRERLKQEGVLAEASGDTQYIPFFYDVIGGVKETAHFLGIQYLRVLPMTTFSQAEEMIAEFKHQGITNQRMNLQGWMNGGYYHDPVNRLKVLGQLGGENGLKSLLGAMKRSGGTVYPDLSLQQISDIAKGFTPSEEASRYYAQGYVVNLARISPVSLRRTDTMGYRELGFKLLSPKFLPRYAEQIRKHADRLGLEALSLRDLANELHADKRRTNVISREAALDLVRSAFGTISEGGRELLVSGGNDYSLAHARYIINAPVQATPYPILDEQIPLWEMIVHGSIDYAGSAINMTQSESRQVDLLHLIDYGASIHYTFTWRDAAEMKYTGLNGQYATTFSAWKDQAVEDYNYVNGALSHVSGAAMLSHEKLSDTLSLSTYSNGVSIYVNTGSTAARAGGHTVKPFDYLVVGGEAQ